MIRCFIHFIHMRVERQCVVDGDAEASNASRYSDRGAAERYRVHSAFNSLSRTGTNDQRLRFVGFNDKPFNVNQPFTASKQRFKLKSTLVPSNAMYSDVSSAYCM